MTVRPPRVAAWLLALASSAEDRPYVLGDLEEELRRRALSAGVRAARRWYWSEALASAAPLLHRRLTAPGRTPAGRHRDDHAVGGDPMWRDVGFDLLVAARVARRNLAASVAIVLTAALCIGVTTAVFGVVNAVLLRPLPFPDSERVVRLGSVLRDGERTTNLALADLDDFRREVRGYELAAGMTSDRMTLSAPGAEPELVAVTLVDSGYARLFALRAAVGRLFQIEEFVYGGGRVVVISHSYWRRRFGGDPAVLGRTVMLDDEPRVVVGVLAPHAYTYPDPGADALVPLVPHPQSWLRNRGAMWMDAVARLRPGVTPERAQSELGAAAAHIAAQFPAANEGIGAYAEPLRDAVVANVRQMLVLLAAAVAAVLLITCANIANLLLAQAQARGREFAVRAALGGSGGRIRRQVLTETLLLSSAGGALGLGFAPLLTRLIVLLYPGDMPRAAEVGVDLPVLVAAVAATTLAAALTGWPVARRAAALDLARDLRSGGRAGTSRAQRRAGNALVVTQVAVSTVLVFAAGLLVQTLWRLTRADPGFDPRGVMTFGVSVTRARYPDDAQVRELYTALLDSLRAVPGVREVGLTSDLPFTTGQRRDVFEREGKGDRPPHLPMAAVAAVSPGYAEAMRIPLLRGRALRASDDARGQRVLLINEALAKRAYPGEDPIGRGIIWNGNERWEIVGVVRSAASQNLWEPARPELFAPYPRAPLRSVYFVVRGDRPPSELLRGARQAVRRVDPTLAMASPAPMTERVSSSLAPHRFRAGLVGGFGALALLLAVVGIYGVVAYGVSRRTREIGIRMALGEDAARVQRTVIGGALRVAVVGAVAGSAIALAAGGWLSTFLVDSNPRDPVLLAAIAMILLAVTALAALVPARHASRVDPAVVLQSD